MIHSYMKNPYDITTLNLLGKGHNGQVYILDKDKVIKISNRLNSFIGEYNILDKVRGNKYFPQIYEIGLDYMIRDYVEGENLYNYIKKNGLNRELSHKIILILKEFKLLKFKKIDVRCKDIYIDSFGNLKIIDPKKFYTKERSYPKHLIKGLKKLNVLDEFLQVLKIEDEVLYNKRSSL